MYAGNDPNLQDLQAQITALTVRVNSIDGQNLADPTESQLARLSAKYEGVKTDLRQAVGVLEGILNGYRKTVLEYLAVLKQHLGVS